MIVAPAPLSSWKLPYRIVRFGVELVWWITCAAPVPFLFLAPMGGELRTSTPVSLSIEEPSFRIVRLHEGVPTSSEVAVEELRGSLMAGAGPGWGSWLVFGGAYAIVLWVAWLVRRIVRSLGSEPFDRRNPVRIRTIGLVLLAFQVLRPAVTRWQAGWVEDGFLAEGATLSVPTTIGLTDLLYPLLLLVLAEVFARGARIEQEQALTV